MATDAPSPTSSSLLTRYWRAPLELQLYGLFCILVVGLHLSLAIFGPSSIREAVIPFTGWWASMPYLFGLYFVFALIFTKNLRFRQGAVAVLVLYIVFGVVSMFMKPAMPTDNPYLLVSSLRPLWVILTPLLWILVLYSPRIRRYCTDPAVAEP